MDVRAGFTVPFLAVICCGLSKYPHCCKTAKAADGSPSQVIVVQSAPQMMAVQPGGNTVSLEGMSVGELRTMAASRGVNPAAIEVARDADLPKQALIALISQAP